MKLLYVLPYVPSLIRVRPYHLIRELAQRHSVHLLVAGARDDRSAADLLAAGCAALETVPIPLAARLRSCALATLNGRPLQSAVCQSPLLTARLQRLLQTEHFDLVHFEHIRSADLGLGLPRNVPAVFDAVDCISLLLQRTLRGSHSALQRIIAALELEPTRRYEARLLRHFAGVTVTSAEDRAALQALAPGVAVDVVPNGVDLDYFRPSTAPREPATLVFSGKMSYHANVTAVLTFVEQVLPRLRAARPDVRLRIVGSDPPARVRALVRDPLIAVTGQVADLRPSVEDATLAVCPVTVKVGIQNKVLEAMALGLPVVSTPAGATGLTAQPDRDLLVGQDWDDFAAQVLRLLADRELRERVGLAGRRYVEREHRWSTAADRLEAVYHRACQTARAPAPAESVGTC